MTAFPWPILATGLALAPAVLFFLAAVAAPFERTRRAVGPLLILVLLVLSTQIVANQELTLRADSSERELFTWSPLGLYGVRFLVQWSAVNALLLMPPAVLALIGWLRSRSAKRWSVRSAHWSFGGAYLALTGAAWAITAADLVSLHLGIALFLLGTVAVLGIIAGPTPAGLRLVLGYASLTGLLYCVLLLGKINGHFQISRLSTSGFRTEAFVGLLVLAAFVAAIPPFHGWVTRIARHPLAPALASGGVSLALALMLLAFRATTGEFEPMWQRWLAALAWVSAVIGAGIALARRSPCVRLSAVFAGRAGIVFLAGAAATPAAVAGSLLYLVTTLFLVALLWLLATNATGQRSRQRPSDVARTPGFWLQVILIASAVGLPFTVGGLARSAFVDALTAWPAGNQLHRFPLIVADGATLVVAAGLLWDARYLLPLRGWSGWLGVATAALLLVLPAMLPGALIASWFDPAAAAAAGTVAPPLALIAAPSPFSIGLGVLAFWILLQRIRHKEWLPAVGHAFMGAAALGWLALRRQWRQKGWSAAPSVAGTMLWGRFQRSAERAMAFLRPFEERYYAGVAVLLAVAAIYIIGR